MRNHDVVQTLPFTENIESFRLLHELIYLFMNQILMATQ